MPWHLMLNLLCFVASIPSVFLVFIWFLWCHVWRDFKRCILVPGTLQSPRTPPKYQSLYWYHPCVAVWLSSYLQLWAPWHCSVTCTTNVLPRYHLLISGPSCIVSSIYTGFWPADQMLQPELEINWIFNQFVQISLVLMASCLMDRNTDVMPILITDVPKLASSVCLYR